MSTNSNNTMKAMPIFLAFLCMGFGDSVGPLVGLSKETFHLTTFRAQLIPTMGFIMFGLLSVIMGLFQDRKGKKFLLVLGLILAFIGMVIPIIDGMYGPKITVDPTSDEKFYIILFAMLILGAGATTLQVSGNPIMRDVSPEGKFSSNLSFAQTVKAVGSSFGFLIPSFLIIPLGKLFGLTLDWTILFPIYGLFILLTLLWVYSTKIEEKKDPNSNPASLVSCLSLLKNPYILMMVLAIFLYVGAEVSMSSGVPLLVHEKYGIDLKELGLVLSWGLFFFPIFIGRLIGGFILRYLQPKIFLVATVLMSLVGIVMMFLGSQSMAFAGIVLVGLGFANIFPLVFSITIDKMPERSNEISGLMVTAIVGGAFIPPIFGFVADHTNILVGFLVPAVCLIYILFTALSNRKTA
ncbi:MAG: MFS transporter [Bacteroidota bacterium]